MIKLYPHQEKNINELRQAIAKHQAVLLQAATGYGKTAVASFITRSALERDKRVIFMVHRKEIIEQTSKTFERQEIPHGFIQAGLTYDPQHLCHIASTDTLVRRLDKVRKPDLLISDEAHHIVAGTQAKIVSWAKAGGAKIVGLSATPERLDGRGLREFFDYMVPGPTITWLIQNKYLSDYMVFAAPFVPDMGRVSVKMGEYSAEEIDKIMDDIKLFGCAVSNYKEHAAGMKAILFAPSIRVSEKLAQHFSAEGIPAAHLDGGTPKAQRRDRIAAFADGELQVLCNVNLFGEGFDLSAIAGKDVPIEAVILYRPTMSLSLHLQQIGRGLRPKPYPAVILDHVGNCRRHGLPDDDREWSLDSKKRKKKKSDETEERIKQCPECYNVHKPHLKECPHCDYIYVVKERDTESDFVPGTLEKIDLEKRRELANLKERDREAFKRFVQESVEACHSYGELVKLASLLNYKKGWAWYQWQQKT